MNFFEENGSLVLIFIATLFYMLHRLCNACKIILIMKKIVFVFMIWGLISAPIWAIIFKFGSSFLRDSTKLNILALILSKSISGM